ncbi:hypothetical protein TWF696_001796 [Orbilia brochopaga]|uniref:Uncharacterized protein n=1 Tax=Orbilia brochopaga TaxID=3140254 RepID=A0AAV9U7G1_9PEZI
MFTVNVSQKYARVPREEEDGQAEHINVVSQSWWKRLAVFSSYELSFGLSVILNIFLIGLLYISHRHPESSHSSHFPQLIYSPVQDAIHYELKTFESSFHDNSAYTGYPDSEINQRWKQLYRVGNSRISKAEAAQLPNKTIAATTDSDDYLVVISVFHDLHCLDRIRQSLWYFYDDQWNSTYNPFTVKRPETYKPHGLNGIIHLDHCINIIRQSVQCFSDVTPYVFQWSEEAQAVHAYANVVHTCRNFEAVREWALERTFTGSWDGVDHRDEQGGCRSGESGDCL